MAERPGSPVGSGPRGALVVLAAAVVAWAGCSDPPAGDDESGAVVPFPAPSFAPAPDDAPGPDDFVGAEACRSCHAEVYAAWAPSTHGRAGGAPSDDLLVAPFDGSPIRFRDATVVPRRRDGAWEFVVRQDGHPEAVYRVDGVVGGGHMLGGGTQGFVSRRPDGTERFLPWDWSRQAGRWFCNTGTRLGEGWVPIEPTMALADCGDWPPVRVLGTVARFANCQECHGSQIRTEASPEGGFATGYTSLAVNCESCHGPGRAHVEAAPGGFPEGDLRLASLSGLDKDASLGVCFRCHAVKDVLEEGYLPGDDFETRFALKFPVLGDEPYFADGRVKTFAYQAPHLASACYLDGPMDCVSCHAPHGQGYRDAFGRPLDGPFDDRQCTSCHASKAADPERHTFHPSGTGPADEAGVRCVSCHMPYLQHPEVGPGVPFARSDHTIPVPRPAFDDALGVVSACETCHAGRTPARLQADAEAWWGELRPHRPLVEGLLHARGEVEGGGSDVATEDLLAPAGPDAFTQFQALARVLTDRLAPDADLEPSVRERLTALTRHPDLDVRALALASLHWAEGDRAGARDRLVEAMGAAGPGEEALRRRWALALGFLADRARDGGDLTTATAGYRKALQVLPGDGRILAALGLMYQRADDPASAAEAFRRSLEADPRPLTWVNLGIVRAASGDAEGAIDAYREAVRLNPHEALAWFNLGNLYQRAGDTTRAEAAYRRAVEADPGLGRAHFYLGRLLGTARRYAEALGHARRAVEFEPDYAPAREMLGVLERLAG